MTTNDKILIKNSILDFVLALLAGVCISIGGIAYLSSSSKVIGALFFCVGLFVILLFNLNLFTGKVCYALDNSPLYILKLFIIWSGNFVGAVLSGYLLRLTRLNSLIESAKIISSTKLNDNLFSIFILAIFCNILIYVAVEGFKNGKSDLIKGLSLIFGVSVFVLCGFEHCVANMFYFSFSSMWSLKTLLYLLVMTLGNIVGGLLFPLIFKLKNKLLKKENIE